MAADVSLCLPKSLHHVDRLRNDLYESSLLKVLSHPTSSSSSRADDLLESLLRLNSTLTSRPDSSWIAAASDSSAKVKALAKARQHGFFLGMMEASSWISLLIEVQVKGEPKKR